MKNIGYNPAFVLYSVQYYGRRPRGSQGLGTIPPSYVLLAHGVRDGQSKYPALAEIETS